MAAGVDIKGDNSSFHKKELFSFLSSNSCLNVSHGKDSLTATPGVGGYLLCPQEHQFLSSAWLVHCSCVLPLFWRPLRRHPLLKWHGRLITVLAQKKFCLGKTGAQIYPAFPRHRLTV